MGQLCQLEVTVKEPNIQPDPDPDRASLGGFLLTISSTFAEF